MQKKRPRYKRRSLFVPIFELCGEYSALVMLLRDKAPELGLSLLFPERSEWACERSEQANRKSTHSRPQLLASTPEVLSCLPIVFCLRTSLRSVRKPNTIP